MKNTRKQQIEVVVTIAHRGAYLGENPQDSVTALASWKTFTFPLFLHQ